MTQLFPCTPRCSGAWDERNCVIRMEPTGDFARGLVKTLDMLFSPTLSAACAIRGTRQRKQSKNGRMNGIVVDELVESWVRTGCLSDTHRSNAYLMAVIQYLADNSLTPIATQFPVCCARLRVGTCVDIVCRTHTNAVVLIELKCGFDDYYDVANQGNMSHPFRDLPATYRNRHLVQLLLTTYLYTHCVQTENLESSVLLRVYTG